MAFALPVLAGCALVAQNVVMAAMLARGHGLLFALIMNSLVGLVLLCGVALMSDSGASLTDAARRLQPWFLASGLLGTFFVFASLRSYRALGAAPTIALITAAQMVLGLLFDATGAYVIQPRALGLGAWVGAALLICGVALIVSRRT
jgi:transporter family-2 protein